MGNKLTAIQTLEIMIEDRIGVSTMADQSQEAIVGYQMALVGIKLELKKLLELEKEQIINARIDGDENHTFNSMMRESYANDYYNETYGKK